MHHDRRDVLEERFRSLLVKWLNALPPDGWEGTSHALGDALAAFDERHRLFAFVPTCPGRKVAALAGFLSENGFALTHRRTKSERTVRFTRTSRNPTVTTEFTPCPAPRKSPRTAGTRNAPPAPKPAPGKPSPD